MALSIDQPIELLLTIAILGFACFRMTRLVATDAIFKEWRDDLISWLAVLPAGGMRSRGFRSKLAYLIGCEWCVGIWVSLILAGFTAYFYGVNDVFTFVILWFAVAGFQSVLFKN